MTRVFWCEPTGQCRVWLRRFVSKENGLAEPCPAMPGEGSYHNAKVFVGDVSEERDADGYIKHIPPTKYEGDARWPAACACGRAFEDKDYRQVFTRTLYIRMDQPTLPPQPIEDMPPGAMWDAWWLEENWRGADGLHVMARCPDGHDWLIDQQASNCTMKDDNVHKCWVRHGDVKKGEIHVDKNGFTCAAGAGSIDTGKYHGFLHNSSFT